MKISIPHHFKSSWMSFAAALSATFIETVVLAYVENDPSCASALDDAISDELEALNLLPYCASIPGDWPNLTIDIIDWNHTYLGHEVETVLGLTLK